MAVVNPGRYQDRDPVSGSKMSEGITAIVAPTLRVTYQARWEVVEAVSGRRKQPTKTFKTLAAAEEHLLTVRLQIVRGEYKEPSRRTLAEYFPEWSERQLRNGKWESSSAWRVRRDWAMHYQDSPIAHVPIAKITRRMCQEFADSIAEQPHPKDPSRRRYAPSSVRLILTVLSGILEAAFKQEMIDRNPAFHLELPQPKKQKKGIWSAKQAQQFLASVEGTEYAALWWLMLTSGCRVGEAIGLHWSAIDFEQHRIMWGRTLRRQLDGTFAIGEGTKASDVEEPVPMIPEVERRLRELQRASRQRTVVDLDGLVFERPDGKPGPLTEGQVRSRFEKLRIAAGLPRITLHGTRHTAAMLLKALGVSDSVVKDILRHQSIVTTVNTYMQADEGPARDALDLLAKVLDTTTSPSGDEDVVGTV